MYGVKQNGKHGYGIFKETNEDENNDENNGLANIEQVEMILNERGVDNKAFILPFESFRTVYRFLKRTRGVYSKMTSLLVFSIIRHKEGGTSNLKEAAEQFMTVLHDTFRVGDAITQNGNSQFFVLLTNTDAYRNVTPAVKRISDAWDKVESCKYFTFKYEWKVLDS